MPRIFDNKDQDFLAIQQYGNEVELNWNSSYSEATIFEDQMANILIAGCRNMFPTHDFRLHY